jgi:hypothetical protein
MALWQLAFALAGVEPPPLDLGAFGLLDPAAFSPILQDIAHRLIMPCMEHLSRITWDRLAIEYEGRHREMSSQGLILAQADAGFSDARQRLRALEDQQSLGLLSSRTGALERQVDDASRLVEQRFGLFRQCSQAYIIALREPAFTACLSLRCITEIERWLFLLDLDSSWQICILL